MNIKINSPRGTKSGGGEETTGYDKLLPPKGEKKASTAGGRRRIPLNFKSSPPKTGGVRSSKPPSPAQIADEPNGVDSGGTDYNGGGSEQKPEEKPTKKSGRKKQKKLKKQLQFLQNLLKKQSVKRTLRRENETRVNPQIAEEEDDDDRLNSNKKVETEDSSFSSDGRGKDRQSAVDDNTINKAQAGWQTQNIDADRKTHGNNANDAHQTRQSPTLQVAAKAFDAFFQNGNTPKLLHEGLSACIDNLKKETPLSEKTTLAVSGSLLAIAKNLKAQNTAQDPKTDQARLNMMSGMAKTAKLLQENPLSQKKELLPRLAYAALHVSEYAANRAAQGAA